MLFEACDCGCNEFGVLTATACGENICVGWELLENKVKRDKAGWLLTCREDDDQSREIDASLVEEEWTEEHCLQKNRSKYSV